MTNPWKLASMLSGAAYTMAKLAEEEAKPSYEEIESDLDAVELSHKLTNRALVNMTIQLSESMDTCRDLTKEARRTKLAHDAEVLKLKTERDGFKNERDDACRRLEDLATKISVLEAQVRDLRGDNK